MTLVELGLNESLGLVSAMPRPAAQRAARRSLPRMLWSWLAASAVVYPGGGIVHLLQTLPED